MSGALNGDQLTCSPLAWSFCHSSQAICFYPLSLISKVNSLHACTCIHSAREEAREDTGRRGSRDGAGRDVSYTQLAHVRTETEEARDQQAGDPGQPEAQVHLCVCEGALPSPSVCPLLHLILTPPHTNGLLRLNQNREKMTVLCAFFQVLHVKGRNLVQGRCRLDSLEG